MYLMLMQKPSINLITSSYINTCINRVFLIFLALSENRFTGRGVAATIYRIVAYVWILFGLAYLALIINYISSVLVKKAEKVEQMSKAKIEVTYIYLKRMVGEVPILYLERMSKFNHVCGLNYSHVYINFTDLRSETSITICCLIHHGKCLRR